MKNKRVGRYSALTLAFCFGGIGMSSPAYSSTPFDNRPGDAKEKITEEWKVKQEMEIDSLRDELMNISREIRLSREEAARARINEPSVSDKGSYKKKAVVNGTIIYYSSEDQAYISENEVY